MASLASRLEHLSSCCHRVHLRFSLLQYLPSIYICRRTTSNTVSDNQWEPGAWALSRVCATHVKKTLQCCRLSPFEQDDGKAGNRPSRTAFSREGGANFTHIFQLVKMLSFDVDLLGMGIVGCIFSINYPLNEFI